LAEQAKKQAMSASLTKPQVPTVNNPNAGNINSTPAVVHGKDVIEKALAEKEKQIADLSTQVNKVDEILAKNIQQKNRPPEENANGLAKTIVGQQKEAERMLKPNEEKVGGTESEKRKPGPVPFEDWKAKQLTDTVEKKPDTVEKPKDDVTQSLTRSVIAAPSPSKIMSSSSVLAAVLSEENSVIERIQSQLTSAYQRVFTEVDQKLAVQSAEIERLKAALEAVAGAKDEAAAHHEKELKDKDDQIKQREVKIKDQDEKLKSLDEKLKSANDTIETLKKQPPPLSYEEQLKVSSKKVAESIQGTFDKSVSSALNTEGSTNAAIEVNRIANAIKKEIAISFLKELNTARKNGDETANLSMSSLGASALNSGPKASSYAAVLSGAKK